MLPKYSIEYTMTFRKQEFMHHMGTDDPVAAEEFLEELLERGCKIRDIRHDGVELPPKDFDKMIRTAAGMLAARRICDSLGIKPEEEHHRFGFTA
jgi:hypothetical protein